MSAKVDEPIAEKRLSVVTLTVRKSTDVPVVPVNLYKFPLAVLTTCPLVRLLAAVIAVPLVVVAV